MKPFLIGGLALSIVVGGTVLSACNSSTVRETATAEQQAIKAQAKADSSRKAFEGDYNPVMKQLAMVRDSVDTMLVKVNADLGKMRPKAKERAQKEAMKAELQKERQVVIDAIAKIQDATESTWADFRADAHTAADNAKQWWAGLKDDKATIKKVDGGH